MGASIFLNRVVRLAPVASPILLLFFINASHAQVPMSPLIGITPSTLDFGQTPIGSCKTVLAQVYNASSDPESVLEVSGISIDGADLTIEDAPSVPFVVPGDGSPVPVLLRVCPNEQGLSQGEFTVIAHQALNSPYEAPVLSEGLSVAYDLQQFEITFDANVIIPPNPPEGPLAAFSFTLNNLSDDLEEAGVISLEKLLPWFTPEDVHGTNELGEEILLHDMSWAYIGHVSSGGVDAAIDSLRDRPGIQYVGPDYSAVELHNMPNDLLFDWNETDRRGDQWGLHNDADIPYSHILGPIVPDIDINAPEAWDKSVGGPWAKVAVLDTGVDLSHPDLHITDGYNFLEPGQPPQDADEGSHGTAVAGIIGAMGNNSRGGAGTSWGPLIAPVRCLDSTVPGQMDLSNITRGIDWARENHVPIANASFGTLYFNSNMALASGNLARSGGFLVSSMGNSNTPGERYPAAFGWSVFSVGALWLNGNRWQDSEIRGLEGSSEGSNYGAWIDVCAPGGAAIVTTKRQTQGSYFDNHASNANTPIGLFNGFVSFPVKWTTEK
jgi:subtilisin family serine protease